MAQQRKGPPTPPPPLDPERLRSLALRYVERFATSEAKLTRYLHRKLYERGWGGDAAPPLAARVDTLVASLVELGYVNDRAFGEARTRGLSRRGFGPRRVTADLGAAGLTRELASELGEAVDAEAAAERFAERRRFGPYDAAPRDPDRYRKQVAAMLRAGHGYDVVRRVLADKGGEDGLNEAKHID